MISYIVIVLASAVTLSGGNAAVGVGNPLHNAKEHINHILDDLSHVIKTKKPEEMTQQELQFHYFKLHDFDGDNRLDGLELGKALTHHHSDENNAGSAEHHDPHEANLNSEDLAEIVDSILEQDDRNNDGYVDFYEFMSSTSGMREETEDMAQERAAAQPPANAQSTQASPPGHQ